MKAFGQLADDGVIDLQKEGRGQYQKFFLFGPNQWAQAEAEVARGESNTTAYKK